MNRPSTLHEWSQELSEAQWLEEISRLFNSDPHPTPRGLTYQPTIESFSRVAHGRVLACLNPASESPRLFKTTPTPEASELKERMEAFEALRQSARAHLDDNYLIGGIHLNTMSLLDDYNPVLSFVIHRHSTVNPGGLDIEVCLDMVTQETIAGLRHDNGLYIPLPVTIDTLSTVINRLEGLATDKASVMHLDRQTSPANEAEAKGTNAWTRSKKLEAFLSQ